MPFPWGQSTLSLSFTCPFCHQTYYNENGTVQVCECPEAQQARLEAAERERAFNQSRQQTPEEAFAAARQNNKVRSRRGLT